MPTVCVTGASSFIASHIIAQLLEKGYHVNCTVRDVSDEKKTKHLKSHPGADGKLTFFSADLTGGPGVFDNAVAGCDAVMHLAMPWSEDGENGILKLGVAGLESVLGSVKKNVSTVKSFVLTSSMFAVAPKPDPDLKTESHWSNADEQKSTGNWYAACKTLQEKLLYDWAAKEKDALPHLRVASICPTVVLGPMLQPSVNSTNGWILKLFKNGKGGDKAPNGSMSFVDVRDCAAHHIAAMEMESASGRYMSISVSPVPSCPGQWQALHWNDIFKIMKELHPAMRDVPVCDGDPVRPQRFDLSKMSTLLKVEHMRDPKTIFSDLMEEGKKKGLL